ncbi:hypothetical protein MmTuc01_0014 [Methanosarcina mazei Tuc01]|uniref:Uncharacterized protein n=1 Tax=Methanosarcina mazei Tuc01 TaxID=1236903 RepID=M1QEU0_METMZ|nr:hypothetical protein MmTuc01_0014 [Methanosarcina mazei Tuc01]
MIQTVFAVKKIPYLKLNPVAKSPLYLTVIYFLQPFLIL